MSTELGYIDRNTHQVTVAGWRRIEYLRVRVAASRQAFVAMWFDSGLEDAWIAGFKPGIEASRYFSAMRIDRKEHNNRIDNEIIAEIRRSGLVVADFTGGRAGVYFEAGLAAGLGIPVIYCCRKDHLTGLHFDTRQISHVIWEEPLDLCRKLDQRIQATVLPLSHLRGQDVDPA